MSRKDYELIAGVISRLPVTQDQLSAIAGSFAIALRHENSAFNIGTFMKACRPGINKKDLLR